MSLEIIESTFEDIEESVDLIVEWTSEINEAGHFTNGTQGMMKLDAVAMRLQVIGELLKNVNKRDKEFLIKYPGVEWAEAMKLRDIISHHYSELNADIIFKICKNDIPQLKKVVVDILNDLKKLLNS